MIVDSVSNEKGYLVHYSGWSSSWDEVVSVTRLLPDNEEGRQRKKEFDLQKKRKAAEARLNLPVTKSMNQLRQTFVCAPYSYHLKSYLTEPRIPVKMPESLSRILVNDWIVSFCECVSPQEY